MEDELRLHSEFLMNMAEGVLVVRCRDDEIIYVNPQMEEMFGYDPGELIGKKVTILNAPTQEKSAGEISEEIHAVLKKHSCWSGEIRNIKKDGSDFWCRSSVSTMESSQQGTVWVGAHEDITERRQAEEQLKEAHKKLEATQLQLLQTGKMKAMWEIAAGIAHELTQPLLGVSGFASALLEDMKIHPKKENLTVSDVNIDVENAIQDLTMILHQTDRMAAIVNNVRTFARESKTKMTPLDINQPIEDALMLFSEQLRKHNIVLKKNLSPDLPKVTGNANQLQQVFINLITNARDAIDAKGSKGQLLICTRESTDGLLIEVEDSGIGADATAVSKMFEPFFTTKTLNKGTGLDLPIVAGIIDNHNGTITVRCEPGRGCKFTIQLPTAVQKWG
ncbi:MAG: PAS domain S-box protein [Bacteroidales bacterium]|nr:PAS domain S-box protein [Bacteroidales bacterium]